MKIKSLPIEQKYLPIYIHHPEQACKSMDVLRGPLRRWGFHPKKEVLARRHLNDDGESPRNFHKPKRKSTVI
jgi:hypothetical protein